MKKDITLSMSADVYQRVEEMRGGVPRSRAVDYLLRKAFEMGITIDGEGANFYEPRNIAA